MVCPHHTVPDHGSRAFTTWSETASATLRGEVAVRAMAFPLLLLLDRIGVAEGPLGFLARRAAEVGRLGRRRAPDDRTHRMRLRACARRQRVWAIGKRHDEIHFGAQIDEIAG